MTVIPSISLFMRRPASLLALTLLLGACTATVTPDAPDAPVSDSASATDGTLVIQGSDTEVQLVSSLAEAFGAMVPDADLSVTGGGSATGIAALINGTTDIANSSRAMDEKERELASINNVDVREVVLARDGLTLVTHPSNPVGALSVEQIGRIYRGEITNWADIGGPDAPIVLYGRQSTSGTFGYFRDTVLQADYAAEMRQMEGNQAIVDAVAADEQGIGYVGVGYLRGDGILDRIKALPLSREDGGEAFSSLDRDAVLNGSYPLARPIYQYVNGVPAAGSLVQQFLAYELSEGGQATVEQSGFYPVTEADATANAALLGAVR